MLGKDKKRNKNYIYNQVKRQVVASNIIPESCSDLPLWPFNGLIIIRNKYDATHVEKERTRV